MKRLLSINTASAGTVLVIPDYMDVEGIVALQYLDETTLRQRDAAAHYLLEEGKLDVADSFGRPGTRSRMLWVTPFFLGDRLVACHLL